MIANNERAEVRRRLAELKQVADRLDRLLGNGDRLPTFLLAGAVTDIDKCAARLERHLERLGGER